MATATGAAVTLVPPPADDADTYMVSRNGLRFAGTHLLMELWGVDGTDDPARVTRALDEAVAACGATLLERHVGRVPGGGITAIAVLSESHISLHTWPARGYVAVDVFLCGSLDPYAALPPLRRAFHATRVQMSEFRRGIVG